MKDVLKQPYTVQALYEPVISQAVSEELTLAKEAVNTIDETIKYSEGWLKTKK
ncbi:hypothetical protein [Legionella bononiensis]|uniref:Uncharacterized protein n=1 Tax=Legionella bononiensis TaxID=2793102 RepID=A0ABS1WE00_9GAMM|nr:hypothetical protein [Legionella bononiensis]MBL7479545.1 hypothetical protein [Legionella bononiensis]MBL7527581.1 hypothetical protein [Legionella bononiensis]